MPRPGFFLNSLTQTDTHHIQFVVCTYAQITRSPPTQHCSSDDFLYKSPSEPFTINWSINLLHCQSRFSLFVMHWVLKSLSIAHYDCSSHDHPNRKFSRYNWLFKLLFVVVNLFIRQIPKKEAYKQLNKSRHLKFSQIGDGGLRN